MIAQYIGLRLVAVSETSFITHFAIHTILCHQRRRLKDLTEKGYAQSCSTQVIIAALNEEPGI
ncbi:hypothetical protein MUP79_06325, partial [Candidatus Bathyarchaeota archaeon]|nr:hypothetical protein [Candidatus Bathyarchaeota archaeon]